MANIIAFNTKHNSTTITRININRNNLVEVVKDASGCYGIHYKFGSGYTINEVKELNRKCDFIIFYGHYSALCGAKITSGMEVSFTNPATVDHMVMLRDVDVLHTKDIAADLSKMLHANFRDQVILV